MAIEPGLHLAERLRRRWPEAVIHAGTAESVTLPTAAFDVAVAATSVHWLNLDVMLPKLHRTIVRDGAFAVWRNVFGDPEAQSPPFGNGQQRSPLAATMRSRASDPVSSNPTVGWSD